MNPARRVVLVAAIGGAAAVAGVVAAYRWRRGTHEPVPAEVVTAIWSSRLTTVAGASRSLAEFRGRVLVINYWATWCGPCREEIPILVKFQREYAARGLQFVGIAIDQADNVQQFADEFQINYPLLIGGMDAVELSRLAGNKGGTLPYTLVFGRDGQIAVGLSGALSEARLRSAVLPLL